MIVLFTNIPKNTYHNEISDIVEPFLKGGIFKAKGTVNNIEIIALKENENEAHTLEFQALVNIEPEAAAIRVINKLHRTTFRGCRILVRPYFIRNWKNDKRIDEGSASRPLVEKRSVPCRRRELKMYKIALPEYA